MPLLTLYLRCSEAMEARIRASLAKLASAPAERQRATLKRERLAARRAGAGATICWQFDIQQARTKLGRLYPQLP
jgi:hypothetical protein